MTSELPDAGAPVWPWPDSLDALRAAPVHHTLLFENPHVRVLDTRIPPGDIVPVHTHRWPAVQCVLGWSDFVRRDAAGKVLVDSRVGGAAGPPPAVVWCVPRPPHSLENVGATEIRMTSVELKQVELR